jgi:hypothetical protein
MNKDQFLNIYRALEAIAEEYRGRRDQHETVQKALDIYKQLLLDGNREIPKDVVEQSYTVLDRLCAQYVTTKSEHKILQGWMEQYREEISKLYESSNQSSESNSFSPNPINS